MRFGILGETRARGQRGEAAALGGPGRRALLVVLLLDAGRIVPVERLVDGLYGDRPPAGVTNALQSQVSRLRSVLGDVIENHPAGYRLAVDPDEVDAHRFTRLVAAGRAALAAGDHAAAKESLGVALAMWRGPALADAQQAPFAAAQAARLEELRLAAVEERTAAGLVLGDHRELVPELQELVGAFPLRERLRAYLMRALAGSGRQFEALAVYEDARRELAEALGADPGRELSEAHLDVLRGDVSRETSPPDAARIVSRETSLPAQLTSFVGREDELARVAERLAAARLVTLAGAGGAGKTRLSIEVAGRQAGEVCFVPLAGVTDGADVPQAVLAVLGLRYVGLLPPVASVPEPLDRLAAALEGRRLLLVLDNCEHVVEAAAVLVDTLLTRCPALRVLATSREALGITGEVLCPIPPLSVPPPDTAGDRVADFPAVRLFVARAAAVRPDFELARERAAVLRICAALDGLPLAIELAAARLRSLSAGEIAARLDALPDERSDQLFRLLSRGSRTVQPRQRSLRGVVDWSWHLLSEPERVVLRRASVFAGGWTLGAAESVCAEPGVVEPDDVLDLVDSLVDKSLVVAYRPDSGPGLRYRLLETIRAYAADRLDEAGGTRPARLAHLRYFRALAVAAEPCLRRAEQLDWLGRLVADHDNLTAALHRCVASGDTDDGLRLVAALCTYWMLRGVRNEGAGPARQLLAAVGPRPPEGLAEEYATAVVVAAPAAGGEAELAPHVAAAARIIEAGPARYPVVYLLWASIAGVPDDETYARYEVVQDLARRDPWFRGLTHLGDGYRSWMVLGREADADKSFRAAVEQFRVLGDRWGTTMALTHLAGFVAAQGRPRAAIALIDEALALTEQLGATENRAELLCQRGQCGLRAGEPDAARSDFEYALELAGRAGAREFQAAAHLGLAERARLLGELAEAARQCELAMAHCLPTWFTGEGTRAEALVTLGRIRVAEDDLTAARDRFGAALDAAMSERSRPFTAMVAEAVADLALHRGDPTRAAELLGLARACHALAPGPDALATADAARRVLGGPAYDAAHAQGAAADFPAASARVRDLLATM